MSDESPAPKLAWEPTKEDLWRLYVDEKLSAAAIAKIYGRATANPRSGAELILYYLRKYGIPLRNRVEELAKDTAVAEKEWVAKYPPGGEAVQQAAIPVPTGKRGATIALSGEERAVLELLRIRKLSVSNFDPETKGRVHAVMENLNLVRKVSLSNIARLIGNKTSGYVSYLFGELGIEPRPFEESRLKEITENLRKYERKPFDGTDEDKAYLLGLKHGDLYAYRPWTGAVRVSLGTTHPAMCELFQQLFGPYGHVYRFPRYKQDQNSYEWNLDVILDESFSFLIQDFDQSLPWVMETEARIFAYLSGLLDADGSITVTKDGADKVALFVDYYNSNRVMLEWIRSEFKAFGFYCSLRLKFKEGHVTKKWNIVHRSDHWQLSSYGMDRVQGLIGRLKLRNSEKTRRHRIALSVRKGQEYSSIEGQLNELNREIDTAVRESLREAERLYNETHKGR